MNVCELIKSSSHSEWNKAVQIMNRWKIRLVEILTPIIHSLLYSVYSMLFISYFPVDIKLSDLQITFLFYS